MAKILFVMTGADYWTLADGTQHPTGFWAEEAVAPYEVFTAAGHEVVVATPGGVVPTVDRGSLAADANGGQDAADRIAKTLDSMSELQNPIRLGDVALDDYDAVFYPGGHGPMEDLSVDADSGTLVASALRSGKFAGYRVTGFTNAEERQAGLAEKAKWLLQDRLVALGTDFQEGEPWVANVVVDRNLVTGQNPASSAPLAKELLTTLN